MILDIYESILKYAGLDVDREGFISASIGDRKEPILVDGMRLVLPTTDQLRSFNPGEKTIFHPLSENILRSESNVVKKFKDIINIRLNYTIGAVAQSLLNTLASPELHKHLSPDQTDLLTIIKDIDEKTVTNFIQLMVAGMKSKSDKLFVNIYLKKAGKHQGRTYTRLGVVTFPFYENIKDAKVREKDKVAYKKLFEFMFPSISEEDSYNYGSNSRIAPCLDALLLSSVNIASRLNDLLDVYHNLIEDSNKLIFNSDWLEHFQNLEELRHEIIKIPHINIEVDEEPMMSQPPMQPGMTQPMVQPVMQPGYQQPVQQGYQQPMMPTGMSAPYMSQQPIYEKPELKQTKRGLDFKSLVQVNPSLASVPNALAPHLAQQQWQQQQMMMAQQAPTWSYNNPAPSPQQVYYPQQPMMQPVMMQPQYLQQPAMVTQPMQQPGYYR